MDREKFARKSSKSRGNPGTQSTLVWLTSSSQLSLDFYTLGQEQIFGPLIQFWSKMAKMWVFWIFLMSLKMVKNLDLNLLTKVEFCPSVYWAREKKMNCIENPSSLRDWQEKRRWNFLSSDVPSSISLLRVFLVLKYSQKPENSKKPFTKILNFLPRILLIYEVTSLHFRTPMKMMHLTK